MPIQTASSCILSRSTRIDGGSTGVRASRTSIIVTDAIHDRFVQALAEAVHALRDSLLARTLSEASLRRLEGRVDVRLGQPALAAKALEGRGQAVGEGGEHGRQRNRSDGRRVIGGTTGP